ncbi:hypothetical protein MUG84_00645 [Paenibacillus sp. KQZ6P-2]|uniref:Uncharacterized protein n=1 Tax=Paenibacillus mangrovi TaxID=2931978 RepID=A0A9X2B3Q9_9BACL|nr:hypothetical protein [Paenibacillus mangrovi]MCJ8010248.1 hypothetical protein [Paenibacillus mangrovi]
MMRRILLETQGEVSPVCSKSHITYKFHISEPGGKLCIHFAYGPKNLEDRELSKTLVYESIEKYIEPSRRELVQAKWESYLPLKNLITVSVDDPDSHRGAGHRHDPEQLLHLSMKDASPGLISGPIHSGMWEVTLSLHAVVTDQCKFSLNIWQEEE